MTTIERKRADGSTELVHAFPNGRRARVVPHDDVYDVQLLDCRNDEHEHRLFKPLVGVDERAMNAGLKAIAALKPPTRHKWDR